MAYAGTGAAGVRAGQLDQRITFQTFTASADSEGQPIKTWSNLSDGVNIAANFKAGPGRGEFPSAGKINSERIGVFRIRHRSDFVGSSTAASSYGPWNLRILFRSDYWNVHQIDPSEKRNSHLLILASVVE